MRRSRLNQTICSAAIHCNKGNPVLVDSELQPSFNPLSLRERNRQWGLRELNQVKAIAAKAGFKTDDVISMPANNLTLVFQRD